MRPITEDSVLHVPDLARYEVAGATVVLDPEGPNWAALEHRAVPLLDRLDGATTVGRIVADYAAEHGLEAGKAWLHVHDFVRELRRAGLAAHEPFARPLYPGRLAFGEPGALAELWVHTNNSCNLACAHCLVSSGPAGLRGLPTATLLAAIDEAAALGVRRFYFTGGEPFVRPDVYELIARVMAAPGAELIVLTNATLFSGPRGERLGELDRERVKFQVSLDGARPETNDPVRGQGTFAAALTGVRALSELGFAVSLTTVVGGENLAELPRLPAIAREHGARSQHLMWPHRRGRAAASDNGFFPDVPRIAAAVLATADAAVVAGVELDNLEVVRRRVDGPRGVKYDLGNAGWDSLCLFADGTVYPSAALAGLGRVACGRFPDRPLAEIFRASEVLRAFRRASLVGRPSVALDPLRFLTGGGDIEHAYVFSAGEDGAAAPLEAHLAAPDPYYPIQTALVHRVWEELVGEATAAVNRRSGYTVPRVLRAMGETAIVCGGADGLLAEREVLTLHSNCVLSFDVDKPRALVRQFYGDAAETPKADLCCPTTFDAEEIAHIPRDVVERFYGCGSPVAAARPAPGEVYVDLGSGAGIDVFIAAKKVGPGGRAIGVDMTAEMLTVARENQPLVAATLGYDAVEFREGFLESPPVADAGADVVTSNCVVNLSPDKGKVFREIWRMLKNGGRAVIADIVADREIPPGLKTNPELWGECTVGALTEEGFLAELEKAGFWGIEILKRRYWKSIEGYPFFSVTVRGFKLEKSPSCQYVGQRAVYRGPMKAVIDEEGHTFPRGVAVEICTDTAVKLASPAYAGSFTVLAPGEDSADFESARCCAAGEGCC